MNGTYVHGLLAAAKVLELTPFDDPANEDAREFLRLYMKPSTRKQFDDAVKSLRTNLDKLPRDERDKVRNISCAPIPGAKELVSVSVKGM